MQHIFQNSLSYEQQNFKIQDKVYTDLGATDITRYVFDSQEGNAMQYDDIDVSFSVHNSKWRVFVSEKRRKNDYGDVLIEVYSDYASNRLGWIYPKKPQNYAGPTPSVLAYYVGTNKVYFIDYKELQSFYNSLAQASLIQLSWFDELIAMHPRESGQMKHTVSFNGRQLAIYAIQAYNSDGDYYTESISISLSDLVAAGVSVREHVYKF